MGGGVRHQVGGQPGQFIRNLHIGHQAGGDNNLPREYRGILGELHLEPAVARNHTCDRQVPDVRHQLVGEPVGVPQETLERKRPDPGHIVIEPVQSRVRREVIPWLRRRYYRSIRFRFEEQSRRHMITPGIHRATDDRVLDTTLAKVRGNSQAEWTGADDKYVTHSHAEIPPNLIRNRLLRTLLPVGPLLPNDPRRVPDLCQRWSHVATVDEIVMPSPEELRGERPDSAGR